MTERSATSTFSRASESSLNNSDDADDDESLGVDMDADSIRTGNRSNKSDINAENINLKNEAKKTSVIRCLVITTLLTVAAIVANVALIMTLNEQEVAFKTEYTRLSNRVIEHFFFSLEQRISAADSVVSQMNFQGNDFPYLVTIPYFEKHAEGIRQLSTSMTLSYAPIIRGQEQRIEFEKYADSAYSAASRSTFKSHYLPNDGKYNFEDKPLVTYIDTDGRSVDQGIFRIEGNNVVEDNVSVVFAPIWQVAPFNNVTNTTIMFNQMTEEHRRSALEKLLDSSGFVVSDIFYGSTSHSLHSAYAAPVFALYYPAAKDIVKNKSSVVGAITLEIALESLLEGALYGLDEEPITAVIETSCGSQYSFEVRGEQVIFLGNGSLREAVPDVGAFELVSSNYTQFNNLIQSFSGIYPTSDEALCSYQVSTYPTNDFYDYFLTSRPLMVEGLVGLVFLFTVTVFLGYDCLVERRQRRVLAAAQRTNALVGSLFPQAVRDRLYKQAAKTHGHLEAAPKLRLKNFMIHDQNEAETPGLETKGNAGEPIADLFPEASVLFADISGFSAWASERQPSEVFTLLETFFTAFDTLARRLGIFKVETVGDCYVAASGIPQARDDHAVAIVRFANAMMLRANELAKGLESTLGPGTGDLTIRVGIHSGPVTAGVLRGEKSRFQLFGDTMNSASRIQSTSLKGKVQLSTETANLLIEAGKAHWIEPREDLVEAKGKGTIQTYWLRIGGKDEGGRESGSALQRSILESHESKERLIDWSVTTIMGLVERIVASRGKRRGSRSDKDADVSLRPTHWNVLEEVHEVVELARFDSQAVLRSDSRGTISPVVRSELRDFISQISSLYLDNPFHNFSHASHVTMSCHKLLKRINRPEEVNYSHVNMADVAQELHDATYGISSDPLTQLAIVFSALIHDAGHQGVPNGQLAKENPNFVAKYGNQSLAEQRSLDISLELLEAPCYSNLRACIMPTKGEQERFRQIIINCVLATDIFDRDLGAMRKARWALAFGRDPQATEDEDTRAMDRKATIVLEHVIQASDVAHTMQHWKIYIKWNENLYREMYKAYKEGRSDKDPTEGWYKGELWFFDNYIIPLAKKLKECGVFGISSDEYLHYAQENRHEWEEKGEEIVAKMEKRMKDPVVGTDGDDEFQVDRRSSFGSSLGISSHDD